MKKEVKKELMLIICGMGFLSVYAVENKKDKDHPVYPLINELKRIVRLYESQYKGLLKECFDMFEEIVAEEYLEIDTIAFANAVLTFHQQLRNKKFNPKYKKINAFWMRYKLESKRALSGDREKTKHHLETFANSRFIAKEFYAKLEDLEG